MSHRDRLDNFKKDIRREQLDSFFKQKRIQLLGEQYSHAQTPQEMEVERKEILNITDYNLEQIKKISKRAQTQQGIELVKYSGHQQALRQFLTSKYQNTAEQFYVSNIYCNLYFLSNCPPPDDQLIFDIFKIMQGYNMKAIDNCMAMLSNIINDHPDWRDRMVRDHNLVERVNRLFMIQKPVQQYLLNILKLIFRILHKATPQKVYIQFKKPLCRLLTQTVIEAPELVKAALNEYYLLVVMFPEEMSSFTINSGIFQRLYFIAPISLDMKFMYLTLDITNTIFKEIKEKDFRTTVLPCLRKLALSNYQIAQNTSAFNSFKLKIISYRLIYHALDRQTLSLTTFGQDQIFKQMMIDFSQNDNADILQELAYIFVFVFIKTPVGINEPLCEEIDHLLERTISICYDRLEVVGYIMEMRNMGRRC